MTQIIRRIVGETGRPLIGMLSSLDGTLPASLPQGSTVTLTGVRNDNGSPVFSGRAVTITDWPTLSFTCSLQDSDVAAPLTMRLRFVGLPAGGGGPIDIPDDDHRYGLYLVVTPA
ncbi:MAG: hypothetical protein ACHQWU_04985 [Gemmatimonadales bacterium]|jgi:hypothetical protein